MATSASPTPLALRCEPVDWTVTTPPIGASITADLPRGEQERRRLSGSLRGHSSIQVTVDLYGHFILGADRHHVEALAADIEARRMQPDATPAQHDSAAQTAP